MRILTVELEDLINSPRCSRRSSPLSWSRRDGRAGLPSSTMSAATPAIDTRSRSGQRFSLCPVPPEQRWLPPRA